MSKVTPDMVERLESDIDRYMDRVDLPPKFVIPGGTELSARLDVARAAVRRAERRVAELKDGRRARRRHRPDVSEPALGRRLRDGAVRRRARARAVPREEDESDRQPRERKLKHEVEIRDHSIVADEPEDEGGDDAGPSPQELLAASLACCTAITIEMYADRKGWDIGDVAVDVDYEPAQRGSPTRFDMVVNLPKELPEEQRERLMQIAAKCPVHRVLEGEVMFEESVELV